MTMNPYDSIYERIPTLVVDTSLDAMSKIDSQLGRFSLQLFIEFRLSSHTFGEKVAKYIGEHTKVNL